MPFSLGPNVFLVFSLIATVLAISPSTLNHQLLESRQSLTPSNACVTGVHIIVGGGLGVPAGQYSYIGSLIQAIQNRVPDSNNWLAGPFNSSLSFPNATAAVETQVREHLADYHAACPSSFIAMAGISAGGVTFMNTICGGLTPSWPPTKAVVPKYRDPLIAAILYGEETYTGGKRFDVSTCSNNAPKGHRFSYRGCKSFFTHMQSYCVAEDPYCCAGGTDGSTHTAYSPQFDDRASAFVEKKWRQAVNKRANNERKN